VGALAKCRCPQAEATMLRMQAKRPCRCRGNWFCTAAEVHAQLKNTGCAERTRGQDRHSTGLDRRGRRQRHGSRAPARFTRSASQASLHANTDQAPKPTTVKGMELHTAHVYGPCERPVALVLLNAPLGSGSFLSGLWARAHLRVAADGASNHLRALNTQPPLIPDAICGDLDSATPENLAFYRARGCAVLHDADQDSNDLHKALAAVRATAIHAGRSHAPGGVGAESAASANHAYTAADEAVSQAAAAGPGTDQIAVGPGPRAAVSGGSPGSGWNVIVYGAFGGRFDQEMANMNALYTW
jgi:thiamine pyrophosphokinase